MSKLPSKETEPEALTPLFFQPAVGTVLTVLSGLAFLFVCMILPLVGKAGVATVHAHENNLAFSAVLVLTLVLAILASISKLQRRRVDQSPLPYFSIVLASLAGLLLAAHVLGLLRI